MADSHVERACRAAPFVGLLVDDDFPIDKGVLFDVFQQFLAFVGGVHDEDDFDAVALEVLLVAREDSPEFFHLFEERDYDADIEVSLKIVRDD